MDGTAPVLKKQLLTFWQNLLPFRCSSGTARWSVEGPYRAQFFENEQNCFEPSLEYSSWPFRIFNQISIRMCLQKMAALQSRLMQKLRSAITMANEGQIGEFEVPREAQTPPVSTT